MVKFIKFAGIGGAATLLQFLLLGLFIEVFLINSIYASASSYLCSAIFNYLANYYITFASKESHQKTLPKFVVTAIIGMAFSTLLFAAFQFLLSRVQLFDNIIADHYYLIAQLFATLLTLVVNYLMHKFWIYRR